MPENVNRELQRTVVMAFLDLCILSLLGKQTMTAEGLADCLREKFSVAITPGILYSHLFHLKRDGFLSEDSVSDERTLGMTEKGKTRLQIIKRNKDVVQRAVDEIFSDEAILP